MEKAKLNKVVAANKAALRAKRERAFDRLAKGQALAEVDGSVDPLFVATGSRSYSLRGQVQAYLLDRVAGVEHDVLRIALDLKVDESKVAAALSHIYRRSKYNAAAVGYSVVRGPEGGPILHKAGEKKAATPRKAKADETPALPAPEVEQAKDGEAA